MAENFKVSVIMHLDLSDQKTEEHACPIISQSKFEHNEDSPYFLIEYETLLRNPKLNSYTYATS